MRDDIPRHLIADLDPASWLVYADWIDDHPHLHTYDRVKWAALWRRRAAFAFAVCFHGETLFARPTAAPELPAGVCLFFRWTKNSLLLTLACRGRQREFRWSRERMKDDVYLRRKIFELADHPLAAP